jgi:hypothetical protein
MLPPAFAAAYALRDARRPVEDHHDSGGATRLTEHVRFPARLEPFKELDRATLKRVAATLCERHVSAGEAVLVEGGEPGGVLSGNARLSPPR